jgi:acetoin utilization deacetylase AcuC-like enzyme
MMKKVVLRNNEYMATMPPYRFSAGDVIEVEDDWADQLVRRNIATKAKAGAQTVQELRAEERAELAAPAIAAAAEDRAARRAALLAELDALGRDDQAAAAATAPGGHYADMVTREDMDGDADEPSGSARSSGGAPRRRGRPRRTTTSRDGP